MKRDSVAELRSENERPTTKEVKYGFIGAALLSNQDELYFVSIVVSKTSKNKLGRW